MKGGRMTRGAGILIGVISLPSPYGIGTMGKEAFSFVDMLSDMGQKYWQVLPVGPTSYGDSPYQSFSAFAGNPYLIDLDLLIEEGLLSKEEVNSYNWGEREDRIDYALLYENRFQVLESAFKRFDMSEEGFRSFCRENGGWLEDYSLYMAVKNERKGDSWLSWEEKIRNRAPEAMESCRSRLKEQISFWKFLQYKFFEQWKALKAYANSKDIKIIGDVPLYVALDSADVWAEREQFKLDQEGKPVEVSGCPPDAFSDEGQKWGNPIYDWDKMKKDGFAWWKKRMEANGRMFDIIRIDHFIGLARYYSIPAEDTTAKNGRWNLGPGKKLTDMIEKTLGANRVIAEDLGVRVWRSKLLLYRTGWPGMRTMLFAFNGSTFNEHHPRNYGRGNLAAYTGTHDNETLVGYFQGKTDQELACLYQDLKIQEKSQIPDAIIQAVFESRADIALVQMQDYLELGNEARMNFPSTVGENWRWRMVKGALSEEKQNQIKAMTRRCHR